MILMIRAVLGVAAMTGGAALMIRATAHRRRPWSDRTTRRLAWAAVAWTVLAGTVLLFAPLYSTTDLGSVIRRVNKRFGTDFAEFDHTPGNAQVCFDAMDRHWRARVDSAELLERYVNRPSEIRRGLVAELAPAYRAAHLRHLRYEADRVHAVVAEAGA